jgi:hypothetical protein
MERIQKYPAGKPFFGRSVSAATAALCLLALLALQACTPAVYQINLKFIPPEKTFRQPRPDARITVATFNDVRRMDDRLLLGQIKSSSDVVPILPMKERVPEAVTSSIRDVLTRAGYKLTDERPPWDLKESTINPHWGKLVIGGNIDTLEMTGEDAIPVKSYQTKVRLTFVLADSVARKILYRSSVETSSALKDITFSGERIEKEVNATFTDALMKMLNDPATINKIDEALSEKKPQ